MTDKENKKNTFKPPSKIVINIYGLLAILLVIIPEWIAELTLTLGNNSKKNLLPKTDTVWDTNLELKLSTMSIKELRSLALKLKINGYSRETRDSLSKRLLKNSKINQCIEKELKDS